MRNWNGGRTYPAGVELFICSSKNLENWVTYRVSKLSLVQPMDSCFVARELRVHYRLEALKVLELQARQTTRWRNVSSTLAIRQMHGVPQAPYFGCSSGQSSFVAILTNTSTASPFAPPRNQVGTYPNAPKSEKHPNPRSTRTHQPF